MAVGCSGLECAPFQPCCILRQIKFLIFYCVSRSYIVAMTFVRVPVSNLICLLFEIVLTIFSDDDNNGHFMSAD